MASTVWAESTTTTTSGWGIVAGGQGESTPNSYYIGDAIVSSINTADTGASGDLFLRSNARLASATVTNLSIDAGDTLKVDGWYTENADHPEFTLLTISNLAFGSNSKLAIESGNTVQVNAHNGSLSNFQNNGTLILTCSVNETDVSVSSGSLVIASETATVSGKLYSNGGHITLGDGSTKGIITVGRVEVSDKNGGGSLSLNVKSGYTLKITGDKNDFYGGTGNKTVYKSNSFMVSEWNNSTTMSVEGTILAEKAAMLTGDKEVVINIENGGILAAKGLGRADKQINLNSQLNLKSGGKLILGDMGVNFGGNLTATISGGTIGIAADNVTISEVFNITGEVTLDTAKYSYGETSLTQASTTGSNATIAFSNGIALADTARLTIQGGGTVNFGASPLEVNNTITVLDGTKLELAGVTVNVDNWDSSMCNFKYYDSRGEGAIENTTGNGFGYGTYLLFDGYEWNGVVSGYTTSYTNGDTYLTDSTISGVYYINSGEVDINHTQLGAESYEVRGGTMNLVEGSVKSSEIDYQSGAIVLASTSSSLIIDSAADHLLTLTTGVGNIEINNTSTLEAGSVTQITGNFIVNSGGNLRLGGPWQSGSAVQDDTVSIAGGIVLKGGQLSFCGDTTTLNSVTTEGSTVSKIYVRDMYGSDGVASGKYTIENLTLNGGTQYQSDWKSETIIKNLTGTGELQLLAHAASPNGGDKQIVTIYAGTGYTGHLNLDGGADMTVNLNIAAGATTKIKTDNSSTIGTLTLAAGSSLRYDTKTWNNGTSAYGYTLKEVVVGGMNTAIKLEAQSNFWQGCVNIEYLTNAKDENGAIIPGSITLSGNAKTTNRDVMNLNGGDFEGTITYKGATGDGSNRKHALNIKSGDAAAKAVINLEAANSANNVALGIAADKVNVKGITGTAGTIYSGEQSHLKADGTTWNDADFSSDNTVRTLAINTAGGNYSTSATVANNLNIEKSGKGSQTFSGNVSAFNGSLSATAGLLAFTSAEALNVQSLSVQQGAEVSVSKDATVGTLTVEKSATFNGGNVNANLTLAENATVTINSAVTLGSGTQQQNQVLLSGDSTVTGYTLSLGSQLTLQGSVIEDLGKLAPGSGEVILFSGVDTLELGNMKYKVGEDVLTAANGVKLSDYFKNDSIDDQYYIGFNANGDVYAGLIVPEPATATLSLLALAGLCARRRRASR